MTTTLKKIVKVLVFILCLLLVGLLIKSITSVVLDDKIKDVMINYGIPLDSTYTAKAFYGMCEYLKKTNINISLRESMRKNEE